MDYLLRGLLTGMLFGVPVGAVGALAVQRAWSLGVRAGLLTGLGSSVADCLYACVGAFGFTLISDFLLRWQTAISAAGSRVSARHHEPHIRRGALRIWRSHIARAVFLNIRIVRRNVQMAKRRALALVIVVALAALLAGCERGGQGAIAAEPASTGAVEAPMSTGAATAQIAQGESSEEESDEMKMNVQVNGRDFTATLERNGAVDALVRLLESGPVTLQLSDYAGFEKVGPLGTSLPTSNRQTTTHAGDIVLYQGNQIVMFYGSNAWSYTRLGHIDDLTGWARALGDGDVTAILSLED